MPQMSPIYWLFMMMYFIFMMLILIMFIFFFFKMLPSMNKFSSMVNDNSMNWMW